jgi:hypothetical protein
MSTVLVNLDEIVKKPKEVIFRKKANSIAEKLKGRGIGASYCSTNAQAIDEICKMVPEGATVALGGSVSIMQSGLLEALRKMKITLLDRYRSGITDAEVEEMGLRGMTADILLTSSNAITTDGKIVNEDGHGNRVAALIFGPKKVILLVGINKIVGTVEDGLKRIKEVAAPLNCIRLGLDTPCALTGFCVDEECHPPARICSQITVIEASRVKDRMHVVIVGEELGY